MSVVCVLGMHRSGTSALMGTLREAGLHVGAVMNRTPDSPKGNQEHLPIVQLHDRILARSGGSWRVPPAVVAWSDEHRRERDAIVGSFGERHWGFKDPRTLLLLDFWRETRLPLEFVGTVRHPAAVVRSLQELYGGDQAVWLELWAIHNRKLLNLYREAPFPIVCFRAPDYRQALVSMSAELGLVAPSFSFLEDASPDPQEEPPAAVEELWAALQAIAH